MRQTMSSSAVLVDVAVVGDATSVLHHRYDRMMRLLAVGKFGKIDLDPQNKTFFGFCVKKKNSSPNCSSKKCTRSNKRIRCVKGL